MIERRMRWMVAFLGLSSLWLVVLCAPALAHASLLETDPADGAKLSEPPTQVQLRFNEPIEAEFTPVKVLDQQGNRVDRDDAQVGSDDRRMVTAGLKELSKGTYTVQWRVISADTHPVNGSYEFSVTGASTNEAQGATEAVVGSEDQSSDQSEPGSEVQQQDTSGWSAHLVHFVGLGFGALILLVYALRRK
ncbi:MAG TPA: copper homeostasis periplasmic binding protein CopC [Rubrobacteraceae bacterium]|nr:copper homeostasis periplasmic binding protein CopC [Rubrobacteraceae bacterium]